ncbi:MAG: hypothetical protein ACYC7F_02530 [Gemmatimonadaceae bacterium]
MRPLRFRSVSPLVCALLGVAATACVRTKPAPGPAPRAAPEREKVAEAVGPAPVCQGCERLTTDDEVLSAVASRVADLKARGGVCEAYGTVLEGSLAAQRIVVRPFMWRVGPNLASAQAKSTGEIDVAREVDALNIGRRSLDEVLRSVEHEAAHIAFAIPSGAAWNEALVDERIGECRGRSAQGGALPNR